MSTYFRRLWAALLGRGYQPLGMGDPISFRGPSGLPVNLEITGLTYHQDIDRVSVLTIEARPAIHRMSR